MACIVAHETAPGITGRVGHGHTRQLLTVADELQESLDAVECTGGLTGADDDAVTAYLEAITLGLGYGMLGSEHDTAIGLVGDVYLDNLTGGDKYHGQEPAL